MKTFQCCPVAAAGLILSLSSGCASPPAPRLDNAPKPAVPNKVADRFAPAAFDQQSLGGLLGERMKVNLHARLLTLDVAPLLEGFQKRPGRHDWIGEHAGKFLHAACNAWAFSGNADLKARIDAVARDLIATQKEDGYLGTYLDEKRWTSWDVWSHKYALIGLLTYYQMTGDPAALGACRKVGDLLAKTFGAGEGQRDLMACGTHVGMAPGSVLEPMVLLYRCTGEPRYLDFCRTIAKAYDESPRGPKLIRSLTEHGNVFRTANKKAYEMLSCLVGLAELYRMTGDETYLKPCVNAWNDVAAKRLYITGTTSHGERFHDDGELPGTGNVGEMCVTVTWLQLTWQLLRLTGDPRYAAEHERTIYNALLGAQHPEEGSICYFTPLVGSKRYNAVTHGVKGVNCCISSGQRGIALIPQLIWGTLDGAPAIWQYAAGKALLPLPGGQGQLTLTSATTYPFDGAVTLTVSPPAETEFPLYLRVPTWCAQYTATVGSQIVSGKAGELVKIQRRWKPGDQVAISIDLTVRALDGGASYPDYVALQRGPQVFALDYELNPPDPEKAEPKSTAPGDLKLTDVAAKLPKEWKTTQAYQMEGKAGPFLLVPFADAGQTGGKYLTWFGPLQAAAQKK
jgi:DUF1680 family protein